MQNNHLGCVRSSAYGTVLLCLGSRLVTRIGQASLGSILLSKKPYDAELPTENFGCLPPGC
ncbi:MAG TPA: hypothetical protein VH681_15205, partial [Nitrospiraceae bacterium]